MKDQIIFTIPSKAEYISTVRLVTASILSNLDTDIETLEDIKMSVGEACNISAQLELVKTITVEFLFNKEEFNVSISGINQEKWKSDQELDMSFLIINTLVDEMEFEENRLLLKKAL